MSWLLFLDESGHDHRHMPYEVRGGVALHVSDCGPLFGRCSNSLPALGASLVVSAKSSREARFWIVRGFGLPKQAGPMADRERRKIREAF